MHMHPFAVTLWRGNATHWLHRRPWLECNFNFVICLRACAMLCQSFENAWVPGGMAAEMMFSRLLLAVLLLLARDMAGDAQCSEGYSRVSRVWDHQYCVKTCKTCYKQKQCMIRLMFQISFSGPISLTSTLQYHCSKDHNQV